ncbi:hypothetical protein GQ607_016490 [Colletotrichum asianum]|uniref:Uncharacterized protein n=1 Tax=Colletotrichum asianum TaxID=702518 RepID=A0A8H3ZHL9_9PEZI|nr:hypothetical protein GQ607_016490 [Colletotrichum asianum]
MKVPPMLLAFTETTGTVPASQYLVSNHLISKKGGSLAAVSIARSMGPLWLCLAKFNPVHDGPPMIPPPPFKIYSNACACNDDNAPPPTTQTIHVLPISLPLYRQNKWKELKSIADDYLAVVLPLSALNKPLNRSGPNGLLDRSAQRLTRRAMGTTCIAVSTLPPTTVIVSLAIPLFTSSANFLGVSLPPSSCFFDGYREIGASDSQGLSRMLLCELTSADVVRHDEIAAVEGVAGNTLWDISSRLMDESRASIILNLSLPSRRFLSADAKPREIPQH